MKSFFSNRIFLSAIFFIIGGICTLGVTRYFDHRNLKAMPEQTLAQKDPDRFFNNMFNDDFFGTSRNPFKEMQRMQEQMLKQFGEHDGFQDSFDNWYQNKFGGGSVTELNEKEDNDFVYYEINTEGQTPKELKVDVKNGQVNISAEIEKKEENEGSKSVMTSSFHRSFPVPPNVDAENFKMEQDGKKIVIKFPKKK